MSDRRFVLDLNVIISAVLLNKSVARQAFDKVFAEGKCLLSLETIDELNTTLRRDKFNRYVSEEERLQFLAQLVHEAKLIEIGVTITDCRDKKDNKFLELAVSGHADAIISGDDDLLVLHPFRSVPIFTPRSFIEHEWDS